MNINNLTRHLRHPGEAASASSHHRPEPEDYDIVTLGSGAGAKLVAWTFAKEGKRVASIERKYIGGACPNIACLPSKNIVHSAKVASYVRASEKFGISKTGFKINMAAVRERKREMVTELVNIHIDNYKKSGAELILGSGRFVGPRTLEVTLHDGTRRVLRGTNVIIGTGSRAAVDSIPGLAEAQPLTHVEALELDHVPDHLLVIGGGFVGLEFSQAMLRFGSKVTVVEHHERLLHGEDEDVSAALLALLEGEGLDTMLGAKIRRVSGKSGQSVTVVVEQGGVEKTVYATHILVSAGRVPNTQDIGLDLAGVEVNDRGHVKVNPRLETTAPGVWAVGDVTGGPHFTHISEDDFRMVHENINGGNRVTTGRQVPFCLFTDPEFARVGLSEAEATKRGIAYRLFKVPLAAVLRAHTLSAKEGFLKALVEADGDRILGFAGIGVEAGEIMSGVQIAMLAGLPYTALRDATLTHPTMMEGLLPLFGAKPSIHG